MNTLIMDKNTIELNQHVRFVKTYDEYTLQKSGVVVYIESGIVHVKTDERTIYKLILADADFYALLIHSSSSCADVFPSRVSAIKMADGSKFT
jgi:hypothetical protein